MFPPRSRDGRRCRRSQARLDSVPSRPKMGLLALIFLLSCHTFSVYVALCLSIVLLLSLSLHIPGSVLPLDVICIVGSIFFVIDRRFSVQRGESTGTVVCEDDVGRRGRGQPRRPSEEMTEVSKLKVTLSGKRSEGRTRATQKIHVDRRMSALRLGRTRKQFSRRKRRRHGARPGCAV